MRKNGLNNILRLMTALFYANSAKLCFSLTWRFAFILIIQILVLDAFLMSFHERLSSGQTMTSLDDYTSRKASSFPKTDSQRNKKSPLARRSSHKSTSFPKLLEALPGIDREKISPIARLNRFIDKKVQEPGEGVRLERKEKRTPSRLDLGIMKSTINVPGEFTTIQSAIDAAVDGDTILVSSGTYHETLEIVNKNVTLQGEGNESTIINGRNSAKLSAIKVSGGNVNINSFTIENAGLDGIDILDSKATTLEKNVIKENVGAGIYFQNSTGTITNNTVRDNKGEGMEVQDSSNLKIADNVIEGNEKVGLFWFTSTGTITNNTIANNKSYGVFIQLSTNVKCTNNHVTKHMQVGILIDTCENIEITGNEIADTIISNGFGSGLEIVDSSALINDNTIKRNGTFGLGVFGSDSIVEIKGNSITDNKEEDIHCSENPVISGCCNTLSNNGTPSSECSSSLAECPCPDESDSTLSITPSLALLTRLGGNAQLTAVIEGKSGATLNVTDEATWTSSDKKIATVDETGLVTAIGNGEVEVCAEYQGLQACIMITVNTVHFGINQWTISNEGKALGMISAIAIDPANPDVIYAGTEAGKIFKSIDDGETWQEKSEGLWGDSIIALAIDSTNPHTLYAGAYGTLYKSIDAGENWDIIYEVGIYAIAINPVDTKIIYAGSVGAGMLKSDDGGKTFKEINTGLEFTTVREDSLVINPKNPEILFIAVEDETETGGGVFKTTNGGNSWDKANNGLPTAEIKGIAINPVNPNMLFAGTTYSYGVYNGVYKTTDGGENWFELKASPHEQNEAIKVNAKDSDILYVGNWGKGVFESRDSGESWEELTTQLTNRTIFALTINPEHPTIFAGTSKGPFRFKHAFTEIKASPNSDGVSIDIKYKFNEDTGITPLGFNIYRSTSVDGDYEKITDVLLGTETTSFNDLDFLDGVTHAYKMTVVDKDGETLKSFSASARPLKDSNPDFDMKITEPEKSVVQGESISFPITLTSQDNFGEEVFLKVSGLPEGTTGKFTPTSGVPPLAVTLNVSAGTQTPTGDFKITVTATGSDKAGTATVTLGITETDSNTSKITQTINATEVRVGDKVEIAGEIIPAQEGEEVTNTFTSPAGVTSSESSVTDTNGKYSAIKLLDKSGTWEITSSWNGNEKREGATSQTQEQFVSQAVTTISMATNATSKTVIGDTLTLTGKISPSPGEGNIFLEIDNLDGSVNFNSFVSISAEGKFTYEFKVVGSDKESGQIDIHARFDGTDEYGGSEKGISVPIQEPLGMAIIVAGGGNKSSNTLWEATNSLCNYVYAVLKNQGIPDDTAKEETNRIYYLHPDSDNDADGDGTADTDGAPTTTNLKKAINKWALGLTDASSDLRKTTPLTIYMMGPGGLDKYKINGTETVKAADFKDWLNQLFSDVKKKHKIDRFPVNVILESPQSGSFINDLKVEDGVGSGRIVITSTDSCEAGTSSCNGGKINITGDGSISFTKHFFYGIKIGKSVTTSWAESNLAMQKLFEDQRPQLDADGDGEPNEEEDENSGSQVFISRSLIPKEDAGKEEVQLKVTQNASEKNLNPQSFVINQRPVIEGVQENLTVYEKTATLWAIVDDSDDSIEDVKVQGLLFPPKSKDAKSLELVYSQEKGRFEVITSEFDLSGLYKVMFVASDKQGNTSVIGKTSVNSLIILPVFLKGIVLDSTTKKPIKGAKVTLQGVSSTVKTGEKGSYLLQIPAGVYTLFFTKESYVDKVVKDFEVSSPSGVVTKNIRLSPE